MPKPRKGLLESRLNCFLHQSARILDARVENSVHSNRNAQGGMFPGEWCVDAGSKWSPEFMKVAWEKTVRWNEGAIRYHGVPYLQNLPTSCPCGKCFFLPFGVRYFGLEFRRIKYENMSSHRNLFLLFFFKDAHQVWLRCTCAVILCN